MSTHVVEQPVFSIVPLILTFDFDLILGLFFYFWGPNWLFFWSGYVSITVLWSIYVVDQLLLSQPSPKSNPNSNLGLAGQHNWS